MKETIASQLMESVQLAIKAGWSVNAIAESADVPQSALQMWVSGTRQGMKLDTAAKLAAFFGQKLTKAKVPNPPDDVMPQKGPVKKPAKKKTAGAGPAKKKRTS